jgi:hypothetical protein
MKANLNAETVGAYIKMHNKLKMPFTLTVSNYTTKIKSNAFDLHFMKNEQSNKVFAAFAKIKKDCLRYPLPKINKKNIEYYNHAFDNCDFYADTIFNIDIKSAYATVLYIDGFISQQTFDYINSLKKQERLACVGMLAGKKNVFAINENGEITDEQEITSPTADYFFYCVKRVQDIIQGAAKILGDSFLFSWVDGIYFLENPKSAKKTAKILIESYFKNEKYFVTFEQLKNFHIENKKDFFRCTYEKMQNNIFKEKSIVVPKMDSTHIKKITDYLKTKKYD